MSEIQLWAGYYQLIHLDNPNIHYFGHLIGFAESRDNFQQKIETYKTRHQCKLTSQLAPLPATTWFQRHGYQADILSAAQQLDKQELRFLIVQHETHSDQRSYLVQETLTISPLPDIFQLHTHQPPYLPEPLIFHPFFSDLNSRDNPQEGLFWHNPNFTPNPDTYRYYAIVDGVRSFILPQLCESEGRTDSLYKGELKNQMDTNAPYLTQLTVSDRETADFTRLLFTQAEKIWFGCWDINPAIFVRTKRNFDEVHYHLRKFTHLYQEETDKWYFFRFYDPRVLVPYLNYIANDPARLASFFGVKEGESIIESFAARIENRFYIFSLENLPEAILPVAVTYDDYLKSCFEEIEKEQFLNKLLKIIMTEFPERKILAPDIEKYFHNTLELGFKLEGSIINLVKSLCYLSGDMMKLKNYQYELKKEYGSDLSEAEIGELLYEKARLSTQH